MTSTHFPYLPITSLLYIDLPQPVTLLQHLGKISVDSDLDANWKEEVESKVSSYAESCEDDRLDIAIAKDGICKVH